MLSHRIERERPVKRRIVGRRCDAFRKQRDRLVMIEVVGELERPRAHGRGVLRSEIAGISASTARGESLGSHGSL